MLYDTYDNLSIAVVSHLENGVEVELKVSHMYCSVYIVINKSYVYSKVFDRVVKFHSYSIWLHIMPHIVFLYNNIITRNGI